MHYRDVIAYIARRLPHRTQPDVAEVVELLTEVWAAELTQGEAVSIPGIGKLTIEVQDMKAGGALRHRLRLRRVYGRLRLTPALKRRIQERERE